LLDLDDEKSYGHSTQDNSMAHTAKNSIDVLDEVFTEWIVSQGQCPLSSPEKSEKSTFLGRTSRKY
jgi:hypothetical protein